MRKKSKFLLSGVVVFFVLSGGFLYWRLSLSSDLEERLDAIREAGYPVTCRELDEWYSIPLGTANAADSIMGAFGYYQEWPDEKKKKLPIVDDGKFPDLGERLDDEVKSLISVYLADNEKALELLHEGSAIEHSRYPADLSAGMGALAPHLSKFRTGVRMLGLEGLLAAEENEGRAAVKSIKSIIGAGQSLREEPLFISQLVRYSCSGLAVELTEQVLSRTKLEDDDLIKLMNAFERAEKPECFIRAFAGERCMIIDLLRNGSAEDFSMVSIESNPIWLAAYKITGSTDRDLAEFLDFTGECAEALELPLHEQLGRLQKVEAKFSKESKDRMSMFGKSLIRLLRPAYVRLVELHLNYICRLRVCRAGLGVERYRLAEGVLTDKLEELVPEYMDSILLDPFDGKPLRYKKLERGYVIYGVGKDRRDNGGVEASKEGSRRGEESDITFTVKWK